MFSFGGFACTLKACFLAKMTMQLGKDTQYFRNGKQALKPVPDPKQDGSS